MSDGEHSASELGDVVVLGAGLTGLSAAYYLREAGHRAVRLCEREGEPGGLVRTKTLSYEGYVYKFDFTGHFLHLRDPEIKELIGKCIPVGLDFVERDAWIYSHGVFTPYPFQTNLHGLPLSVVNECLLGYIAARAKDAGLGHEPPADFEEWILRGVGEGIAKYFMIPYNTKLWGVPPSEMTTDWMNRFVPPAPMEKVVAGALGLRDESAGYNASFQYPREGGIQFMMAPPMWVKSNSTATRCASIRAGARSNLRMAAARTMTKSSAPCRCQRCAMRLAICLQRCTKRARNCAGVRSGRYASA
jgi:protoporphyrinogen oxidase